MEEYEIKIYCINQNIMYLRNKQRNFLYSKIFFQQNDLLVGEK